MIDPSIRARWERAAEAKCGSIEQAGSLFTDLLKLMADLRGGEGCPWDREQSLASLRQYVVEEAGEVTAAINAVLSEENAIRLRAGMAPADPAPPQEGEDHARTATKGLSIAHHPHREDFDPAASSSGAPLPAVIPEEERRQLDQLYRELLSEIGDLLLQAAFLGDILQAIGYPGTEGALEAIIAKLIRRHPHIYGEVNVKSSAEVLANWEKIKRAERGES